MNCDICGKKGQLFNIEMEGSRFVACNDCSVYGKKLSKVVVEESPRKESVSFKKPVVEEKEEPVIVVVDNYNSLIKNKRERLGLKQEELAKRINEKESLIQQIETKKIEPNVKVAEKLESFLNIKILETYKPPVLNKSDSKEQGPLTLGDMIQIKSRKKK